MRRLLATVTTLALLSGMLLAVLLGLMLYAGLVNLPLAVAVVVAFNLLVLLVSPRVNDFIYGWLYDLEWIGLDRLGERSPASADVIAEVTEEYGYATPKIGVIPDGNPTAFTYGTGRFNGRIVVTEGCFEYLDDAELASVYAHELGHITSRDFIVMTLANTVVEVLYLVAVYAFRAASTGRASSRRGDPRVALIAVAALAYVFYFVAEFAVLYLSRVREYAADAFAADYTHPDHLSSALLKIAYGIVVSPDNPELARATRNIGLMNLEMARDKGATYYTCRGLEDFEPMARALLFDLTSPWARLRELYSTHPLTGKRIRTLCDRPEGAMFDFDAVLDRHPVDRSRLYREFGRDLGMRTVPLVLAVVGVAAGIATGLAVGPLAGLLVVAGLALVGFGVGTVLLARYRFPDPGTDPEETTVLELLGDVYASPVQGRPAALSGRIVGRGQAGYRFSEDLMLQDETGLMYLRYESWLPLVGNLLFALRAVPELVGESVTVDGWFYRATSPWFVLRRLSTDADTHRGSLHRLSLFGGLVALLLGLGLVAAGLVV